MSDNNKKEEVYSQKFVDSLQQTIQAQTQEINTLNMNNKNDMIDYLEAQRQTELNSNPNSWYHNGPMLFDNWKIFWTNFALNQESNELFQAIDWKHWKKTGILILKIEKVLAQLYPGKTEIELTPEQLATAQQMARGGVEDYMRKECIDIFHFLLQLFNNLGMDATLIRELYFEKNKENAKRQAEGY